MALQQAQAQAERSQQDCASLRAEGARAEKDLHELETLLRESERVRPMLSSDCKPNKLQTAHRQPCERPALLHACLLLTRDMLLKEHVGHSRLHLCWAEIAHWRLIRSSLLTLQDHKNLRERIAGLEAESQQNAVLRSSAGRDLTDLRRAHDTELAELKRSRDGEAAELRKAHEAELASVKAAVQQEVRVSQEDIWSSHCQLSS